MSRTLTASILVNAKEDAFSKLPFIAQGLFEQDCLYAYSQEFRIDGSETPTLITIDGAPNYDDMVFMRIEVLDISSFGILPLVTVNSTNGSYIGAYIQPEIGFYDICGTDWWTDDSTSDPDVITSVALSLASSSGSATIRVTAYFNAS